MSKGWKYGIGLGVVILFAFCGQSAGGVGFDSACRCFPYPARWRGGRRQAGASSFGNPVCPQALTALLCGGALAVCGLMLQTAFKNPLAGPSILGINAGASLGVAFVMLLFGGSITAGVFSLSGFFSVLLGAFIGAMADYGTLSFSFPR